MNKLIRLTALLGILAVAVNKVEAGGWFEKATGIRTPEPIRKIAPNGIRFPGPPQSSRSHVTPDSVFNSRPPQTNYPNSSRNDMQRIEQLRAQQRQAEMQRQQQQQLQQQQQFQYQQQLRYQQDVARAQQKAQVIGAIFQGIGELQQQNAYRNNSGYQQRQSRYQR